MSVLVLTHYGDVHAEAIKWALSAQGIPCLLWPISNFPSRQRIALSIGAERDLHFTVSGKEAAFESTTIEPGDISQVTAVWNRRLGRPAIHPDVEADYAPFVREETRRFLLSLSLSLAPDATWVNSPVAEWTYEAKLPQLVEARRAGLRIPETVMTNDAEAVRAHCRKHDEIIYKAFRVPSWRLSSPAGTRLAVTFTTRLTEAVLEEHAASLELAPGIFQPLIRKKSELRVVVLGQRILAARLHSQRQADSALDWRAGQTAIMVEKTQLRPDLERRIRLFMKNCGLQFGCIDLIEPEEGEEVFLEVNQMGQFLWLDEADPTMGVMQAFCAFLTSIAGFSPVPENRFGSFGEFLASEHYKRFDVALDREQVDYQYQQSHQVG